MIEWGRHERKDPHKHPMKEQGSGQQHRDVITVADMET